MQTITTRILAVGFVLWMAAFQTPAATAAPTETPTETPSATPTPTVQASPTWTPEVIPGLLQNFRYVNMRANLDFFSLRMAADPLTGDLWVLEPDASSSESQLYIYDAQNYRLKDSYRISHRSIYRQLFLSAFDMVFDDAGNLYIAAQRRLRQESWIVMLPRGERAFQVYCSCNNTPLIDPFMSLLPIEEGRVPSGLPGPGMLFAVNSLLDGNENSVRNAGIFLIQDASPARTMKRIAALPAESRLNSLRLSYGPNNQIMIMDNHAVYRLESNGAIIEMIGPNSHFHPDGRFVDLAYDSSQNCFYLSTERFVYRASSDFKRVLTVSDDGQSLRRGQIECSAKSNKTFVAFNNLYQYPERIELYVLENAGPYPTPTITPTPTVTPTPSNTPTRRPPISTFRPSDYPTDPAGNPIALVPYVDIRLIGQVHPQTRGLMTHAITNDLYYYYTEELQESWSGGTGSPKYQAIVRGPIQENGGYSSFLNQSVFGRYEGWLPPIRSAVFAPNDFIFLENNSSFVERLDRENHRISTNLKVDEMIFVREDCRFMNVPTGNILFFEWDSSLIDPPYSMGYFDPTDRVISVLPLELPSDTVEQLKDLNGAYHFIWGPDGKLHFQTYSSMYRFEVDGTIQYVQDQHRSGPFQNVSYFYYLSQDRAFYFFAKSAYSQEARVLCRLPENIDTPQPILSIDSSSSYCIPSTDGDKLFFINRNDHTLVSFEPHFTPGVPVATPTPTPPPGTPTPTPTPMDWMMLDGFGGIHVSRPEVQKPVLPYFQGFNIARDLEPDPLGRGWYMLDGYGGIHLSSPDLPRPDGLPYFWQDDIARDLEILERDGELTFVIMDGYGRLYVVGPNAADVSMDVPLFGYDMARDLEPAPTGDGWLVMDAYGALFDSRDHSVSVAAGTYWFYAWFARDLSVFPDDATLMVDSYGGRHYAEGRSPLCRLHPIPSELYFWGWEIVWDFEFINN